jgi:ParB/Sulfiredoxin domain
MDAFIQPTIEVRNIKIGRRFRRQLGDIDTLARDIDAIGLLQPIVVSSKNELIAGRRRLAAWQKSKHADEPIPVRVVDLQLLAVGEWSENVLRKAFTPSEAVALYHSLYAILRPKAQQNQRRHGNTAPGRCSIVADVPMRVKDKIAAHCGVSRRTLDKALAVMAAADRDPKLAPLAEKMDRTGRVDGVFRSIQAASARTARKLNVAPFERLLPGGKIGDLKSAELRWLAALCHALLRGLPVGPDAQSIREVLKEKTVESALAVADKARAA